MADDPAGTAGRPDASPTGTRILGLGTYRPARSVGNDEVAERLGLDPEWILRRSGIASRRFAGADETLPAMAAEAGGKALALAGVDPAAVDCVVVATVTHLTQMPAVAIDVAHRVGATGAGAFDVLGACAGFPYALSLASALVQSGTSRYTLVVGAERMTDIIDHDDPTTAFLFADGAGAVVVGPSDARRVGPVVWGADDTRRDAVTMTGYWVPALREEHDRPWPALGMSGWRVFRWATEHLPGVCRRALDAAGVGVDELGAFVPHQANQLITDAVARALELPEHVAIARDIADSGNTSAASIPLAMERLLSSGEASSGDLALLVGFGSGLAYAAQVVELP